MRIRFPQDLFDFWLDLSRLILFQVISNLSKGLENTSVNAVLLPSNVQQPNSVHKLKLGTEPTERHKSLNLNDLPDDLSLLIICLCTYEVWWRHRQILVKTEMSVYSCFLQTEMIKWFSNRMLLREAVCNSKLIVVLISVYSLSSVDLIALINISLHTTLCFNALSPWMYTALYV